MRSPWSLPLLAASVVVGAVSCGDSVSTDVADRRPEATTTVEQPTAPRPDGDDRPGITGGRSATDSTSGRDDGGDDDDAEADAGPATGCGDLDRDPGLVVLSADGVDLAMTRGDGAPVDLPIEGLADAADRAALLAVLADDDRTIRVTVPEGSGPHDVLLDFHGYGGDAAQESRYTRLADVAPADGYLVVAIDGRDEPRQWELEDTDTGVTALASSDVAVVDAALDVVLRTFCGDPDGIHAAGMSNGSVFAAVYACHSDHDVRAVGSVAFTTGTAGCDDDRQVPTLAIHGTADVVVPYNGEQVPLIRTALGWDLEPAEEAMATKAAHNGCDGFDDEAIAPDVLRRTWRGCDADTVFYRIDGGGHGWPGPDQPSGFGRSTTAIDATELIIEFFGQH